MRKYLLILAYARSESRWIAAIAILTLLNAALVVVLPWPLKLLIDYALGDAQLNNSPFAFLSGLSPMQLVLVSALAALVVAFLATAAENGLTWAWGVAGQRMVHRFASDLLASLQRLSLRFHTRSNIGDLLNRIGADTYCVYNIVEALLISPLQYLLTFALILGVSWQISPLLTLVLLAVIPPLVLLASIAGPRLKKASRRQQDSRAGLASFVYQSLCAVPVIQMYNADRRHREQFEQHADRVVRASNRGVWKDHVYRLLNGSATALALAVIIYVGGVQVLEGTLTVGSLVVFIQYSRNISALINKMFVSYSKLSQAGAQVDRVLEVMQSKELVPEPLSPRPLPVSTRGAAITFCGVSYAYEPGIPVLSDINLTIEPGSSVAIVGHTGAGKTTLASLVPRFFDPSSGAVLYNGVDLREVSLAALRSRVAIILQKPFILPMSVRQNIAYGREDASDEDIQAAARAANADGFIQKLPGGYDTILGESGQGLSGGERQRIAIARAFLADAEVLIMDEPTSALDGASELVVLDALQRLRQSRTTLIIAHRLSTTQNCDKIVAMKDGLIVEHGTHDELIRQGGIYANLFVRQFTSGVNGDE